LASSPPQRRRARATERRDRGVRRRRGAADAAGDGEHDDASVWCACSSVCVIKR
jgi:hypothetical protein